MRAAPILTLALAFGAYAQREPEEVLAQTRDKVLERTGRLPNYTFRLWSVRT
jgi:hypothetical protein